QISPAVAQEYKLKDGDVIELRLGQRQLRAPVWITAGQARNSICLSLGYGRSQSGRVATNVGFNAFPIRNAKESGFVSGWSLTKSGDHELLVTTQTHHFVHGEARQIYRAGTWEEFRKKSDFLKQRSEEPSADETLYEPAQHQYD